MIHIMSVCVCACVRACVSACVRVWVCGGRGFHSICKSKNELDPAHQTAGGHNIVLLNFNLSNVCEPCAIKPHLCVHVGWMSSSLYLTPISLADLK